MLLQNNNRANLPRGQSTCLESHQFNKRDSSLHNFHGSQPNKPTASNHHINTSTVQHQPLRMKTTQNNNSTSNNYRTGASNGKPHQSRKSTLAASKENAIVEGLHQHHQQLKSQSSSIMMNQPFASTTANSSSSLNITRAFQNALQSCKSGIESSFTAKSLENPSQIAKHVQQVAARTLSSGRHSMLNKGQTRQSQSDKTFVRSTWSDHCPCSAGSASNLIEELNGNFNCQACGAMAFQRRRNGATDEALQSIFAIKIEENRNKVEAPPQKILEQLRTSSEIQRSELRTFVPANDTFDKRILQVRGTMLELICEVGDCLKQSQLTIHLAVEYMDRYLLLRNHKIDTFQFDNDTDYFQRLLEGFSADDIALTSLLLSSKFDEIDDNIPLIQEMGKGHTLVRDSLDSGFLLSLSKDRPRLTHCRSYPGFHAIQRCELYLLRVLCWDLNTITPLHFVNNHLFQGILFTNDHLMTGCDDKHKALQKVKRHIDYFALQAIKQESYMLAKYYSDQTIAAAIIFAARKASNIVEEAWNQQAFEHMFGLSQGVTSLAQIQEVFDTLYVAYDSSHVSKKASGDTGLTAKSQSEVIVGSKSNPFKIMINFQNLDKSGVPISVETERGQNSSSSEEEAKVVCLKKPSGQVGSSDQGGLSTRGCEVSNSENSAVETLAQSLSMTNNDDFSHAVENCNTISSSAHENSSSSGIEEYAAKRSSNTIKTVKSISKNTRGRSTTKVNSKCQKSSSKTGKKINQAPSTKSSVSTFDQQITTLKPVFAAGQSENAGNNKSLSPIKEFRDRDGPIKVFKMKEQQPQARESRAQLQNQVQQIRERSESQTSLFRLQPTIVRTIDLEVNRKSSHLQLQPRAIVSDESQSKRNNNNSRSGHRKSTSPNVLDFSKQNNQNGRCPLSRKFVVEKSNERPGSLERNGGTLLSRLSFATKSTISMQDLIMNVTEQRNSDSQEKRQILSKSVIFPRKTEQQINSNDLDIEKHFGGNCTPVNANNDAISQNLKSSADQQQRCTSALSQIKTNASTAEIGQAMRSRDQNFIKRNINYVTKLDQKTKDRKSLHASRSFIESDNHSKPIIIAHQIQIKDKSKPSTPYDSTKYEQEAVNEPSRMNDLQKYSEQAPKLSRFGGTKSLKRFSTSSNMQKANYMSNQINEVAHNISNNIQLLTTNVGGGVSIKDDVNKTVTPKQASYRPSKLFSKKNSMVVTSSVNLSVAEQPRSSNPTKTALHKFKVSSRTNSFAGASSLQQQSRNNQRSTLDVSQTQKQPISRDTSQTPLDCSQNTTSAGAGSKQRLQNNHLKPTKSSMLRAKSSLGLTTYDEAAGKALLTTKAPSNLGQHHTNTTNRVFMLNNDQAILKLNSRTGSSQTRAQSPQFGGIRARNFQPLPSNNNADQYTTTACYGRMSKLEVDLTVPSVLLSSQSITQSANDSTPINSSVQTQRERKSAGKSGAISRRQQQQAAAAAAAIKQTKASVAKQQQQNQAAFRGTFSIR